MLPGSNVCAYWSGCSKYLIQQDVSWPTSAAGFWLGLHPCCASGVLHGIAYGQRLRSWRVIAAPLQHRRPRGCVRGRAQRVPEHAGAGPLRLRKAIRDLQAGFSACW